MLKKKINGTWQDCYTVKRNQSGTWSYLDYKSTNKPGLSRYTNGAWEKIYLRQISIINYVIPTNINGFVGIVSSSADNSFWVTFTSYTGSTVKYAKGYFGTFPVSSGDHLEGTLSYYTIGTGVHSILISIVNFASATSTTLTTLTNLVSTSSGSATNSAFSYTFSQSYDYVGFFIQAGASYNSGGTFPGIQGKINSLYINDSRFSCSDQEYTNT